MTNIGDASLRTADGQKDADLRVLYPRFSAHPRFSAFMHGMAISTSVHHYPHAVTHCGSRLVDHRQPL